MGNLLPGLPGFEAKAPALSVPARLDDLLTASLTHSKTLTELSQAIMGLSQAIMDLCAVRDQMGAEITRLRDRLAALER